MENENVETENPAVEQNVATENQEQQESKAFSQEDVDRILKDRLDRERKRFEKKFADVDVDKYRELMDREENSRIEEQKKRGEFEKILSETVQKKDQQINEIRQQLHSIKVEGSLLNAASAKRAVNPQQVVSLLNNQIRLGDTGDAEVIDTNGQVRYTDQGTAMTADQLVEEFLSANPHFVSAGPSGSGAQSSVANATKVGSVDLSSLDMNNPEDRKIYKDAMKKKGIRI
jgi:hypothetical protein